MLLNGEGQAFVAQRIDSPSEAWQMPQGGVDKGEDPRDAVLRELEEEIGAPRHCYAILAEHDDWLRYDLPEALIGRLWGGKYRGQEQKWFALRFTGADSDIDIQTPHPEFSRWRWAALDELPQLIVPFKRDIYAQVVAAFRHLA